MLVKFYETIDDSLLKFAVIISKSNGKWVFCKHRERNTYEIPGGHREEGESILECAKRELYEETGAVDFEITPICVYSVIGKTRVNETGDESFGMLYYADITKFEKELHSEIEKVELFDKLPEDWTYPLIQPLLIKEYMRRRDAKRINCIRESERKSHTEMYSNDELYKSDGWLNKPIEEFTIIENKYDFIMAISALEHINSRKTFEQKLFEIKNGIRQNGIVCLVINSDVQEFDKVTMQELEAQFEVNFPTKELKDMLHDVFQDWKVVKFTTQDQQYDIPRENIVCELRTKVVTLVARKLDK